MVRPRLLPTSLAVISLAAVGARPAAADDWSLHVVANARLGWTDNLFNASGDPADPVQKEADAYTQLDPGLLFTIDAPRAIQELHYDLDTTLYVKHNESWSVNHHAGWRGFFQVSPRSEVTAGANLAAGSLNTFSTAAPTATGQIMILPSVANDFRSADANEILSIQTSRPVRVSQTAFAGAVSTRTEGTATTPATDWTTAFRVGGGFGIDRAWNFNALALTTQLTYDDLGTGLRQSSVQVTGSWRRDLSTHWTSVVDAGAVTLIPLGDTGRTVVQPTVGLQLAYFPTWGSAGLTARRAVMPDLYIRANTVTNTVALNAGLPLHWLGDDPTGVPRFGLETAIGFADTGVLDSDTGDQLSGFTVGLADIALGYRIKPQVNVGVRYQFEHQVANADLPTTINARSFDRNTVLLSFYGRWPDRLAGEVPVRQTLRVDRSNVTPVGEEVVTPGTDATTRPR